jgi:uncharacterized protein (AIM24 family)
VIFREDIKQILARAKHLFDIGQLEEAREALEQGLTVDAENAEIHRGLAYLYYKLGEFEKSRQAYLKLIGMEPGNVSLWSNLGLVYLQTGKYRDSLQAFDEYLKHKPDDEKIISYRARLLAKISRGEEPPLEEPTAPEPKEETDSEREKLLTETGIEEDDLEDAPVETTVQVEQAAVTASDDYWEESLAADQAIPLTVWCRGLEEKSAGPGRFQTLSQGLAAVRLERRLVFSIPSLVMYRGVVVFQKGPQPYGRIPRKHRRDDLHLGAAEGNGDLWLSHGAGGLVILSLENEALPLNAHRLVAFEEGLEAQWLPVGKSGFIQGLAVLRLSGSGRIVLAAGEEAASIQVEMGNLTFIDPSSVVAWTDGLEPGFDVGEDLKKARGLSENLFLRFEGEGSVYVDGGADPKNT